MFKLLKMLSVGLVSIATVFSFAITAQAASATISVSPSSKTVVVGSTVKVTVKISSAAALGSWNFDVTPSSNLKLVTSSFGGSYIVDYASSSSQKTKTYTFSYRASEAGTGTVSIRNSLVYGYDETKMSVTNGSTSINLVTQAQIEASYSTNNNLKSLSVEGFALTPTFDKNVLDYSLTVDENVEKINVIAAKEDAKASISGGGEIEVCEGENKIEILVTSQKGTQKKYTIIVTVVDSNPIEVKIGEEVFTVVKKTSMLVAPTSFVPTTTTIEGQEIPALYSETAKITLVGLKNSDGNINLYNYVANGNKYTLYTEIKSSNLTFFPLEPQNIPKSYSKSVLKLEDKEVDAYQFNNQSKYYLIYGMNIEDGKSGWYMYDSVQNTLQRYNDENIVEVKQEIVTYKNSAIILTGALTLAIITIFVILFKKPRIKKPKINKKDKKKEVEEKTILDE